MAGSRPLPTAPGDAQHSPLEVDHNYWLENDGNAAHIVGQDSRGENIVSYNDVGKGVAPGDWKIISYDDVGKQAVSVDAYNAESKSSRLTEERKIFGLRGKTVFILLAVVLVLIVAAAISGVVGGISAARCREDTVAITTNSPSPKSS